MLYYNFGGYEGFKELFGLRECGNGEKQRRNKILLSYIKQRELVHQAVFGESGAVDRINIKTMDTLWAYLNKELRAKSSGRPGDNYWILGGVRFFSPRFARDEYEGLCEDGDTRAVRYVNVDNGRVFKMKAGKFIRRVCEDADVKWPEPVLVWFCEEFAGKWQAYSEGQLPNYTLRVERSCEAFARIYDSACQVGNFHSCMNDEGYHPFYMDSVDAKAAWLEDNNGHVVARCVIYTQVTDEKTGEVLRLAERQYTGDSSELLKRVLVDKLIAAGEIDGYKRVGADCHNSRAFVGNDGSDWSGREFSIRCDLERDDCLSYQDSFKYYNYDMRKAYNCYSYTYTDELDTTDGRLGGRNYDSWHDEYTNDDVITVYYHGREYTCSEGNNDEFVYLELGSGSWEWHHEDDVIWCEDVNENVLKEDATYSDLLDNYWYDEDEMYEAELRYKEDNWYWSEFDEDFYEDEDDVVKMHFLDGNVMTISVDSAERKFEFVVREGEYYEINGEQVAA